MTNSFNYILQLLGSLILSLRICHFNQTLKSHMNFGPRIVSNSAVGLDRSPSPGSLSSHWLGHLPSLASPARFACSQGCIECPVEYIRSTTIEIDSTGPIYFILKMIILAALETMWANVANNVTVHTNAQRKAMCQAEINIQYVVTTLSKCVQRNQELLTLETMSFSMNKAILKGFVIKLHF